MSNTTISPEPFFTSRNDKNDLRLVDFLTQINFNTLDSKKDFKLLNQCQLIIWGNPDDQGISMNGGRIGAAKAPDIIRKNFYKMTPIDASKKIQICDLGNTTGESLPERHDTALKIATQVALTQTSWISLGGGHDYGFSDAAGFIEAQKKNKKKRTYKKPIIINFDAHLDVRPTDKGHHSGTPFRRLLEKYKDDIVFFEVGIQPQCNSPDHKKWAIDQKAKIIDYFDIQKKGLIKALKSQITKYKNHPCFVSLDMDAFSSDVAPGCSQSWAYGIDQKEFFESFRWLLKNLNVQGLGIYEVAPPLDHDDRTSKLAALVMHHFLFLR